MRGVEFGKRTLWSYLSKLVPTLFTLVYTFLIAGLLGPEDYGTFTYITSLFGGFFLLFMGGMLANTLFVFAAKYQSKQIYHQLLLTGQGIACLIALAFILFPSPLLPLVGIKDPSLLWFGLLFLWLTPFNLLLSYLFKGFNRFGLVFKSTLVENALNLVLSVMFLLFFHWGLGGIFVAKFISILGGAVIYLIEFPSLRFSNHQPPKGELLSFTGWNAAGDVLRQAGSQIYTLLAGAFLSPAALGSYYLAQKIASAAVGLPSAAASEVLLTHSAQSKDEKAVWENLFVVMRVSLVISIAIGAALWLAIPLLIHTVFPSFDRADDLIGLSALFFIASTLTLPANVFRTSNWMKTLAGFQLLGLALTILGGYLLTSAYGAAGLIVAQTLMNVLVGMALIAWLIHRKKATPSMLRFHRSDLRLIKQIFIRMVGK